MHNTTVFPQRYKTLPGVCLVKWRSTETGRMEFMAMRGFYGSLEDYSAVVFDAVVFDAVVFDAVVFEFGAGAWIDGVGTLGV